MIQPTNLLIFPQFHNTHVDKNEVEAITRWQQDVLWVTHAWDASLEMREVSINFARKKQLFHE